MKPTLRLRRDKKSGQLVAYFGATPEGEAGKYHLFLFDKERRGTYDYAEPGPVTASYSAGDYNLVDLYEQPAEPKQVVVEKIVEVTQPMTESDKAALELGRALVLEGRANEALAQAIDARAVAEKTIKEMRNKIALLFEAALAASKDPLGFNKTASCGPGCPVDEEE